MTKIFAILLICFSSLELMAHPLHLSVCNMDINNNNITFSIRLFHDDFNKAIAILNNEHTNNEVSDTINAYIQNKFRLKVNAEKVSYSITNKEFEDASVWIYCKLDYGKPIFQLTIFNTLLIEEFNDQKNLLIIKYQSAEKGFEFNTQTKYLEIPVKK